MRDGEVTLGSCSGIPTHACLCPNAAGKTETMNSTSFRSANVGNFYDRWYSFIHKVGA